MRLVWLVGASMLVGAATQGYAQAGAKPIGTVSTNDAVVTNAGGAAVVETSGGVAVLRGSSTVTAKDRTAAVRLERGGEIRVCQTSGLHVAESPDDSLLMGLDRGAMEIQMKTKAGDVVMTPDLRFTVAEAGARLDLEMRVSTNGDTCVDNRGHRAPTLKITDAFGETNYELKAGQHVTFEHGSLREVVDKETVPCGCPPAEKGVSLADAALAGGAHKGPVTPQQAAAAHPFPAAVSEGLASPPPPPAEAPGVTHVQVATTLEYDPNAAKPAENAGVNQDEAPAAQPAPATKSSGGPLGAFFKRLFVR
jgi:hypothetical protein